MTTELILTPDALTGIMDRGYLLGQETDPHFPIRLSALGHCPRQLRMLLEGVEKREYTPRSLRVFEQGHQRGEALAEAFRRGFWPFATEILEGAPAENIEQSLRFKLLIEHTSWLSTRLHGKLAEDVLAGCKAWIRQGYTEDPDAVEDVWLPLRIDELGYLQVRGRSDLLILDHEHKTFWVAEFKTKNSWGFKALEEEGVGPDYEVQVQGYVIALFEEYEGWTCGGAFVFYEDHDMRRHKVLRVATASGPLFDEALEHVEHLLRNWAKGGPPTEAPAVHADRSNWKKAKHKGALGCLPWQCRYCSIGPIAGECLPKTLSLNDTRKEGADVPTWEVVGG